MSGDEHILVIAGRDDHAALWAYRGLVEHGHRVRLLVLEALAHTRRWEHRVTTEAASISLDIDGLARFDDSTHGVLNRCVAVPFDILSPLAPCDREYAMQEWQALFASWLACLRGPIINPPSPDGLCGAYRSALEWNILAHAAGFAVQEERWCVGDRTTDQGSTTAIFVVGERVVGCDETLAKAARRLAALAGVRLLGISLLADGTFAGADVTPDLRIGGPLLLSSLAEEFATS